MANRDLVAPRPRYRIEERGGQLVVVDEAGGSQTSYNTITDARIGLSRPRSDQPVLQKFYRSIASMVCKGKTDATGRPIFTTDKRDKKGPRSFALGPSGIRRLAHGTLASVALAIVMLGVVLIDVKTGVSISAIFGAAIGSGGKRVYTRWIDGFTDPLIDD